ncbi:hypothetical protein A3I95_02005 [Candidatus Nomurabacteria bacterium RIFCSPLOWO2_02_FULL_44_12]|uniref:Uncharacterized protein n=1 Tax=Candidatus Nomurabacteria bacterium RIFCSPLOWO2_12_FULL_44_11 TaxID=1801796 RepID=A0A1F6Y7H6_9BACT|nr:MAG: hypothetical protein A3E95_02075 [Candidatus Nomurabacteria bacterium RIFCSPHIGHO2_12_FULL_44_22b]OGJ02285.1 MAG: hypothetical protein A3G53_01265 [Candidatus Nomurabacteria bacterium RIFCSPLOWO2_12_FULL_44_11]OGJ07115.1 MAG: hypothetical protein A3I95_02005 [Candidatus Nomurabacteria bacterium RIFCSPLOWO2_02_FULL_44_12]
MIFENIIYFAVSLNFVGHILYVQSIIKGYTKPNLVSWFFWTLAPFLGVFFQIKAGAGLSILPIFVAGFGSLIVMVAAILKKNGFWKISAFDIYCGLFSFLALVFYIFTHNLGISVLFAILSDALASVPTIVKSWKFPETEMWAPYLFPIISNIVGLIIIKNWFFPIYSFGIYFLILDITILFCIYRKKIFQTTYLTT